MLVAHNAPFDIGFLKAAAAQCGYAWPGNQVLDTVRLARRVVTRDEAPNHKLGTLAALFRTTVAPDHRALSDAQATVDVLHALLGRLAPLGVTHLEDLATATDPVPADVRRKRHLADGLPDAPGVYMFRGPRDEVLYVGVSTSLRTRVRSYFTAAEKRTRMVEMVRIAESVTPIVCATPLEARVRELRLIAEHSPRYNRRSRFPERMPWVRLTHEPFPRLSIVREVRVERGEPGTDDTVTAVHIGPFTSRAAAQTAIDALHETFPIRQCTQRLRSPARPGASACALAGMGRCGAPCVGLQSPDQYAEVARAVRGAMAGDPEPVIRAHALRIAALSAKERFEEAAQVRDRLSAFLRGAARAQRLAPLAGCPELIAARRTQTGGWEIVLIRYARLAGTAMVERRDDPWPAIASLQVSGEHVDAPPAPAPAAHPEEADLLLAWLDSPGVRLVAAPEGWACPVRGAQACASAELTAAAVSASLDVPSPVSTPEASGPGLAVPAAVDRGARFGVTAPGAA